MIVPTLSGPTLAVKLKLTTPLLELSALPVTVSQEGVLLITVQGHCAPVLTVNVPVPLVAGTFSAFEDKVYAQPLSWVTVKVCPPTVIVPVRLGLGFA